MLPDYILVIIRSIMAAFALLIGTTKETFKDRKEFTSSIFKQIDEVLWAVRNYYSQAKF